MKPLMLLAVMLSVSVAPTPVVRAGVAVTSSGRCVGAIDGPALPVGTKLTVVTEGPPQRAHSAMVKRPLAESEDLAKHAIAGPYYELECSGAAPEARQIAVVVVGEPTVRQVGRAVSLGVSRQNSDVRVRSCTSTEGVHLTLWSGPELKGPRLWHAYYYLGYDVEPTCRPEDYRDGG
jgi:hypothetical protein